MIERAYPFPVRQYEGVAMVDYEELLGILSIPRPNGSKALRATARAICHWLATRNPAIPYQLHTFKIYPYFLEIAGLWLITTQALLALSIWLRWGWPSLLIAIVSLVIIILEAGLGIPTVSWLGGGKGENIIVEFSPARPKQEIVLSAHYDSKTELLDHRQRAALAKVFPIGLLSILILGVLGLVDGFLKQATVPGTNVVYYTGILLTIPQLLVMGTMGLNFLLGRFSQPSQGAVDNGAACAILLSLAHRLANKGLSLEQTKVTIAIFAGEEIFVQGSRAYVAGRDWPLPTAAINLELMGQNGPYIIWEKIGSSFRVFPSTPAINHALSQAILDKTGKAVEMIPGPAGTDSYAFLLAGIAATSVGSTDLVLADSALHRPTDNRSRVHLERLQESVEIIECVLRDYDKTAGEFPKASSTTVPEKAAG
jgi:hypothetical protein